VSVTDLRHHCLQVHQPTSDYMSVWSSTGLERNRRNFVAFLNALNPHIVGRTPTGLRSITWIHSTPLVIIFRCCVPSLSSNPPVIQWTPALDQAAVVQRPSPFTLTEWHRRLQWSLKTTCQPPTQSVSKQNFQLSEQCWIQSGNQGGVSPCTLKHVPLLCKAPPETDRLQKSAPCA